MPRFNRFRDKSRPVCRVRPWNAEVESKIDPQAIRRGQKAAHHIVIENFDLATYKIDFSAKCGGELLRYGDSSTWAGTITCDGGVRIDPAAQKALDHTVSNSPSGLPTNEQVTMTVTARLLIPGSTPEEFERTHTLSLQP
jgi:hypothetical protein